MEIDQATYKPIIDSNLTIVGGKLEQLANGLWPRVLSAAPKRVYYPSALKEVYSIIIANLASAKLAGYDEIVLPMSSKAFDRASRYKPDVWTDTNVRTVVGMLEASGIIDKHRGTGEAMSVEDTYGNVRIIRKATTVSFTGFMSARVDGDLVSSIDYRKGAEVILLRSGKRKKGRIKEGDLCNYDDTPMTKRFAKEVRAVNRHMRNREINHSGGAIVPLHKRLMYRVFCDGTFEHGGRLFGHWCQNINKLERQYVTIDGEPVCDLDYGSMHIALLHHLDGTVFDVTSDPFNIPGWEQYRTAMKKVAYALLNASKPINHFPADIKNEFPNGTRFKDVKEVIFDHIPIVKKHAFTRVGLKLQRKESDILIKALLILVEKDVGFVPFHDGILGPVSAKETIRGAMHEAYVAITGQQPVIKEKPIPVSSDVPSFHGISFVQQGATHASL